MLKRSYFPIALFLVAAVFPSPGIAKEARADDPAAPVSAERLRADVERLAGFGTRHTLSAQDDPKRGIGAALAWARERFEQISRDCGSCLEIAMPERIVEGRRIPRPTRLRNVVAIQRGSERPDEVVIVQAHIDSRASDPFDATSDAPGANDDGSGSALVLEAARVLSKNRYPTTVVYALLSGEEQGLYGGRLLADWVAEQGWTVKAVLNNDIVGNSCSSDGYCDAGHLRVFSEGPRADLTDELRAAQRRNGGENDSPSRNLSRWLAQMAREHADKGAKDIAVREIWRTDRMGRGGDQIPFLDKGYPAIRISVGVEDYDHQHQDLRVENGVFYGDVVEEMDFDYLAKVTRFNIRALDRLARAPMPPAPTVEAAVRISSELSWAPVEGAGSYRVWLRPTDAKDWGPAPVIDVLAAQGEGAQTTTSYTVEFEGLRGDDWIFAVSSCAPKGPCGPPASAVPAGAFAPASTLQP